MAKPMKELKVGNEVSGWTVTGAAFTGGNARVYPVMRGEGERGALKVLHTTRPESVQRFLREVTALRGLPPGSHPNVVTLLDHHVDASNEHLSWCVMEFVSGGTLDSKRAGFVGKLLPSLSVIRAAASGVQFLHAHDVLHRDLKPDNILLRTPEVPVVSDLGLCWLSDDDGVRLTPEGRPTGAWGFRAPEHEHSRLDEIDPSADVFSLVKILWWLIHGGHPFASAHYQGDQFDLPKKYNDVAMHVVMTMLARVMTPDPKARSIRTPAALVSEIDAILGQIGNSTYVGRIAGRMSAAVERQRSRGEAIDSHMKNVAAIDRGTPALLESFRLALRTVAGQMNALAESQDAEFTVRVEDEAGRSGGWLGLSCGDWRAGLEYSISVSMDGGGYRYSMFNVKVGAHGQVLTKQFPDLPERLEPRLAGEQVVFIKSGDPTQTPVSSEPFWYMLGEAVLSRL